VVLSFCIQGGGGDTRRKSSDDVSDDVSEGSSESEGEDAMGEYGEWLEQEGAEVGGRPLSPLSHPAWRAGWELYGAVAGGRVEIVGMDAFRIADAVALYQRRVLDQVYLGGLGFRV